MLGDAAGSWMTAVTPWLWRSAVASDQYTAGTASTFQAGAEVFDTLEGRQQLSVKS
jgi:hypothetical protein